MTAPFHEIRFPSKIARGAEVVNRSRTSVHSSGGGQERRNKRWSSQLRIFDATRGITSTSDLEAVRAFHIVMDGRHAGFRFQDFSDYTATAQLVDTSAGGTSFQLRKGYVAGEVTKWRTITKPVRGTVSLTLNGANVVVLEEGQTIDGQFPDFGQTEFGFNPEIDTHFTVDHTTGIITPSQALIAEDVLLASFEFDVPVRFGSDDFRVRAHSRGRNWEYGQILINETRRFVTA